MYTPWKKCNPFKATFPRSALTKSTLSGFFSIGYWACLLSFETLQSSG